MKKFVLAGIAFAIIGCALGFTTLRSEGQDDAVVGVKRDDDRLTGIMKGGKRLIPNKYIVVFKDDVVGGRGDGSVADFLAAEIDVLYGAKTERVFKHAINGFAADMTAEEAEAVSKDTRVAFVEQDSIMYANATQSPATWGLDRIDQRSMPLSNSYTYNFDGSGVNTYTIDTGIRFTHSEFAGRTGASFDAIGDGQNGNDCNGHGTHVAGTIAGSTYGVAKGATVNRVRVLNCQGSGSNSGVIAGVDWVTANHVKPAVANMSLGGGASAALDTAVNNSINAGVSYAVAAGNSNVDACGSSPARAAAAITVGSTTNTDARSSFSNFGTCLDIFGPGSSITSSWFTSDTATNTISGTSMASPHVAGVVALYLGQNGHQAPSIVRDALVNNSTTGVVTTAGTGSPNRLLYSIFGGGPPPPTPTPTPTPPPGGGELLSNGGFEGSASPWVGSGTGYFYTANGSYPHGGTGYIYFGVNNSVSGQSYQTVSIPTTATGTLDFWLNVTSSETTTTTQYDRLFVEIRSTSGALLATVATYSNLNKMTAGSYSLKSFNLAAYKGQTVRIQFRSTMDSSVTSTFRVDDVSLR
ncbi:MAG: S8 family serine peptidase [Pyrinomonadaceae bacterium]